MPGNQGGSNWARPPPIPRRGSSSSSTSTRWRSQSRRRQDAGARRRADGGAQSALQAGFAAYQQNCQSCHGADLQGGVVPGAPSLVGVTDRMGEDAIKAIVTGGRGQMRPVPEHHRQRTERA